MVELASNISDNQGHNFVNNISNFIGMFGNCASQLHGKVAIVVTKVLKKRKKEYYVNKINEIIERNGGVQGQSNLLLKNFLNDLKNHVSIL